MTHPAEASCPQSGPDRSESGRERGARNAPRRPDRRGGAVSTRSVRPGGVVRPAGGGGGRRAAGGPGVRGRVAAAPEPGPVPLCLWRCPGCRRRSRPGPGRPCRRSCRALCSPWRWSAAAWVVVWPRELVSRRSSSSTRFHSSGETVNPFLPAPPVSAAASCPPWARRCVVVVRVRRSRQRGVIAGAAETCTFDRPGGRTGGRGGILRPDCSSSYGKGRRIGVKGCRRGPDARL